MNYSLYSFYRERPSLIERGLQALPMPKGLVRSRDRKQNPPSFMHKNLLAIEPSPIEYRREMYSPVILGMLFKTGIFILRVGNPGARCMWKSHLLGIMICQNLSSDVFPLQVNVT